MPSGKAVLIVDNEPDLLEILSDWVQAEGYRVVVANDGRSALDLFHEQEFHIVIADARTPGLSGIEFFEHAQKTRKTPFILISGDTDEFGVDAAYRLGFSEFIPKPFQQEDLVASLKLVENDLANNISPSDEPTMNSEFCRLYIKEFLSGAVVTADIYIKIGDNKYLKIAKENHPMELDRIESYRSKGLEYFFTKAADLAHHAGFDISLANAQSTHTTIPRHKRFSLLCESLEVLGQYCLVSGASQETLAASKGFVEDALNIMFKSKDLLGLVDKLKSHSDQTYAHSLGVGLYSVAIAKEWGWSCATSFLKISMSGILFNIGKCEVLKSLLDKARVDLTADELKLVNSYAQRGQEILSKVPGLPKEVVDAAKEHRELLTNAPKPSRDQRIHSIAGINAVADEFCQLALSHHAVALEPQDAIARLYKTKKDSLDNLALRSLMSLYNMPIPQELQTQPAPHDGNTVQL